MKTDNGARFAFFLLGIIYFLCSWFTFPSFSLSNLTGADASWHELSIYARMFVFAMLYGVYKSTRYWLISVSECRGGAWDGIFMLLLTGLVYSCTVWLVYPSILGPDISDMVWSATQYSLTDKYSYIGALYVMAALSVFPNMLGIYLVTAICFLALLLFMHGLLLRLGLRAPVRIAALVLVAFSPYAIFSFTYINRDTFFVYLFVAICLLIWTRYFRYWTTSSIADNLWVGVIVAAFCAMRPEAIVAFPAYLLILHFASNTIEERAASLAGAAIACIAFTSAFTYLSPSINKHPTYSITGYLNPLVAIITDPNFKSKNRTKDLSDVGELLDLDRVSQRDFKNIPSYFNGALNKTAPTEAQQRFSNAAKRIIASNLDIFLANRVQVLAVTSGLSQRNTYFPRLFLDRQKTSIINRLPFASRHEDEDLQRKTLRVDVISNPGTYSLITLSLWNLIPATVVLVGILFLWSLAPITAALTLANFVRVGVVFLTAPATFTMYYSTVQMGAWILLILCGCEVYVRHQSKDQKRINTPKSQKIGLFTVLSGIGWVFDLSLFTALVGLFGFGAMFANIISACTAATVVFVVFGLLSDRDHRRPSNRAISIYLVYQIAAILVFSFLIQELARQVESFNIIDNATTIAVFAKLIITVLNFATNYIMSKLVLNYDQSTKVSHA